MSDDEAESLALAEERVRNARGIVARQAAQITRYEVLGRSTVEQRNLLRTFEGSLAAFEEHVALLRAPRAAPAPHRCRTR